MIAQSELACLAIADISGYTGYLAGVELDHAQDILADLMGTVVEAMLPFRLAKLEGDAAFAWVPGDVMDGSLMQDAMEGTYVAFRRRLRDIKQASSCDCNACVLIPRLDLKLVVHHGRVARQRIVGWEELVGSDVILVHRLLKNRVEEELGLAAYALYTQAAIDAGGIDPHAQALREHRLTPRSRAQASAASRLTLPVAPLTLASQEGQDLVLAGLADREPVLDEREVGDGTGQEGRRQGARHARQQGRPGHRPPARRQQRAVGEGEDEDDHENERRDPIGEPTRVGLWWYQPAPAPTQERAPDAADWAPAYARNTRRVRAVALARFELGVLDRPTA